MPLGLRAGAGGGLAGSGSTGRKQGSGGATADRFGTGERKGEAFMGQRRGQQSGRSSVAAPAGGRAAVAARREAPAEGARWRRTAVSAEQALENWCIALSYWEHAVYTRTVCSWRDHVDNLRAAAAQLLRPGGLLVCSREADSEDGTRQAAWRSRASAFMHDTRDAMATGHASNSSNDSAAVQPQASRAKVSKEDELAFLRAVERQHGSLLRAAAAAWHAVCAQQRKALSQARQLAVVSSLAACLSHWHLSNRSRKALSLSLRSFFHKSSFAVKRRAFAAWASFSAHVVDVVAGMVRLRLNRSSRMQALIVALWRLHFVPWQRHKRHAVGTPGCLPGRLAISPCPTSSHRISSDRN